MFMFMFLLCYPVAKLSLLIRARDVLIPVCLGWIGRLHRACSADLLGARRLPRFTMIFGLPNLSNYVLGLIRIERTTSHVPLSVL
ncbi:hypothetical protein BJY00DRAFT_78389 [Aspergillus carlsbadensis]|nr:hypothetical protein BJY00DRAFT_78389 [Aspergillus carlsbadensis]